MPEAVPNRQGYFDKFSYLKVYYFSPLPSINKQKSKDIQHLAQFLISFFVRFD